MKQWREHRDTKNYSNVQVFDCHMQFSARKMVIDGWFGVYALLRQKLRQQWPFSFFAE